jgi:hypothetical protein
MLQSSDESRRENDRVRHCERNEAIQSACYVADAPRNDEIKLFPQTALGTNITA